MKSRSRQFKAHSISKSQLSLSINKQYFCHYKNGMYMGEAKNFQKHGPGIVIHDNGTSVLSNYHHDMLHGMNLIIYKDGSLASTKYNKDKLQQVLYKSSNTILFMKFDKKLPDGGAVFINFKQQEIICVKYKLGQIESKYVETDTVILNKIFIQKNLMSIFPKDHVKNLEFSLIEKYHDDIYISKRTGKTVIGYSKDKMLINGLGIILIPKNTYSQSTHNLQVFECGFYKNMQMSGFGHRNFKNGNYYTGEFKYDQFEGTGILKSVQKRNWVCGNFERGSLVQLLTYGDQGQDKAAAKAIQCIHQKKTSWVNRQIMSFVQTIFLKQVDAISKFMEKSFDRVIESKKMNVLRKIQENFMPDQDSNNKNILQQLSYRRRQQIYNDSLEKQRNQTNQDFNSKFVQTPKMGQQSRKSTSLKRHKIFDLNRMNPQNEKQKSSRRNQQPTLILQNSKQIQSRISFIQSPTKQIKLSFGKLPPPLPLSSLKTPPKHMTSQSKIGRSISTTHVNKPGHITLVESKYRKTNLDKMY